MTHGTSSGVTQWVTTGLLIFVARSTNKQEGAMPPDPMSFCDLLGHLICATFDTWYLVSKVEGTRVLSSRESQE